MIHTRNSALFGAAVGALMICASSAVAMPVTLDVRASSAPNAFGSPSWAAYRANALNSLENGLGSTGDRNIDPTAYEQLNGMYKAGDVMVTSGNSWRGQANPGAPFAAEHGNRIHFGVHIQGDGTTKFRMADLSLNITSSDGILDFVFNYGGFDPNNLHSFGVDWGVDNMKGGVDDTIIFGVGSAMTFVDELVFRGSGNAYWPDASDMVSPLQGLIDGTVAHLDAEQPTITGTYSIVADDQQTYTGSERLTYMPMPEPGTLALFGLGLAGLGIARRRKAA